MINITSKGRYALKIMVDLAIHADEGKQQRLEIAKRQGIPFDYIDQILARLRNRGLIESIRGRNGGFLLKLPAAQISAWDIFCAAEETIYPVQCLESNTCGSDHSCSTKDIWSDLFVDLETSLRKKSLVHLVAVWKKSEFKVIMMPMKNFGDCKAPVKRLGGRAK